MSSEQYWRNQVAQTEAEYEQIIQGLRDEVEKQRRRCSDLMHEQAMQRATAASDVRNFCTQYVAEAKQQQQRRNLAVTASTLMASQHNNKNSVDSIPLPALLTFLNEYSHGLLQMPENRRKRERADASLSPLHHRLRQRMLARHRQIGRDDYVLDEGTEGQGNHGDVQPPSGSPCSPPMGPSSGTPRSGPRFSNAAAHQAGGRSYSTGFEASPSAAAGSGGKSDGRGAESTERRIGGDDDSGGPVMTAAAFGLPTLPPR
ncbi:hypothetical protein ABL78_1310 [Leptomonas seymouri]|uniref:Uncharacterized protein n=1 Tax=Leptomonas seymouri TaxID=5684 RepID=A0A0N1IMD3_LEPSE|nr:hypothetical protein ABL78_1310 [Leptomonas seymouri]|eukprot:KPI89542.1 hypothetical protein ABL78_1310 [Leptomonas seymouri]